MTTPGALIAGRYRLRSRVASGGMGSVWEAEDEVLGRRVAVKLLLTQPGMSAADADTARNRVIREARITARLHHPHAVTIYDVVEHAGQPCLIMQFVPSRSLNAILQERGVLPEQLTARFGAELASALTAAHLAGIVHRDIKPSNVLITDEGSAKLTDFGISHAAGDVTLTSTGMVSGTPAYLAPEVARGAPSGFPADVFSLGATLYATLEGAPPFGTDVNPMAILHRVASGQIILPHRSGSLTPLLLHMLAPMPGNRPTMADVARALAVPLDRPPAAAPSPAIGNDPGRTVPHREAGRAVPAAPSPTLHPLPSETAEPVARSVVAGSLPLPPGASPTGRASATSPGPEHRRPALLGAVVAIALLGVIGLAVVLLTHRDSSGQVAAGTATSATAVISPRSGATSPRSPASAARPLPAGAAPSGASSAAASRPSAQSSRTTGPALNTSASSTRPPAATTTRPSTSASRPTTASSSASSTSSSTPSSTTTSSTTRPSPSPTSDPTGSPTASQLAAAVRDYYAGMPTATDDGWAHLTANFQRTIANGRGNYQIFWDSIDRVSVSNAKGTAPGTVEATIRYRFKDGREAVELTRYQLVREDGILKIDFSEVLPGG